MSSYPSEIAKSVEEKMLAILATPDGNESQEWTNMYPSVLQELQKLRKVHNGNSFAGEWPFAPAVVLSREIYEHGSLRSQTSIKQVIWKYKPNEPMGEPKPSAGGSNVVGQIAPKDVSKSGGAIQQGQGVSGEGTSQGAGGGEKPGLGVSEAGKAGLGPGGVKEAGNVGKQVQGNRTGVKGVGGSGVGAAGRQGGVVGGTKKVGEVTARDVEDLRQEMVKQKQILRQGLREAAGISQDHKIAGDPAAAEETWYEVLTGNAPTGTDGGKRKRPSHTSPQKEDEEEEQKQRGRTSEQIKGTKKKLRTNTDSTDTEEAAREYQLLNKGKDKGKRRQVTEEDEMEVDQITRPPDDNEDVDMENQVSSAAASASEEEDNDPLPLPPKRVKKRIIPTPEEDKDEDDQDNQDEEAPPPAPPKRKRKPAPKKAPASPPPSDEYIPPGAVRAPAPPGGKEDTWKSKPLASIEVNDPPCSECVVHKIACYKVLPPDTTKKGKGKEAVDSGACFYCANGHSQCSLVNRERRRQKELAEAKKKRKAEEKKASTSGKKGGTSKKSSRNKASVDDLAETVRKLTDRVQELERATERDMIASELLDLYKRRMDDNMRQIAIAYASVRENLVNIMRHMALLGRQDNHLNNRLNAMMHGLDAKLPEEYRAPKFNTCPEPLRVKLTSGTILETTGPVEALGFRLFKTMGEDYPIVQAAEWPTGMAAFPPIAIQDVTPGSGNVPSAVSRYLAARQQPQQQTSLHQDALYTKHVLIESPPARQSLAPGLSPLMQPSAPSTSRQPVLLSHSVIVPQPGSTSRLALNAPPAGHATPLLTTSAAAVNTNLQRAAAATSTPSLPPRGPTATNAPGLRATTSTMPANAPPARSQPASVAMLNPSSGVFTRRQNPAPRAETVSDPDSPTPPRPRPSAAFLAASISTGMSAAPSGVAGPSSSQLSTVAHPPSSMRDDFSLSQLEANIGSPLNQSPPPDVEMGDSKDEAPPRGAGRGGRGNRGGRRAGAGGRRRQ